MTEDLEGYIPIIDGHPLRYIILENGELEQVPEFKPSGKLNPAYFKAQKEAEIYWKPGVPEPSYKIVLKDV